MRNNKLAYWAYQLNDKVVATLGGTAQATTDSAMVAQGLGYRVLPTATYEEAEQLVLRGQAPWALVPDDYPALEQLMQNPQIRMAKLLVRETPDTVLACRDDTLEMTAATVVYADASSRPLWPRVTGTIRLVASKEVAARLVAGCKGAACITNPASAAAHNLKVRDVLRTGGEHWWCLFGTRWPMS